MSKTQWTFHDLFDVEGYPLVAIPMIQRDYAHGRTSAKEVLTQFLDAIRDALLISSDGAASPLNLDFVYGSVSGTPPAFCPLDGQQRLTTLFFLHWYLAMRDGKSDSFRKLMSGPDNRSRFTYKIRSSSEKFFDALVCEPFDISALTPGRADPGIQPSDILVNARWFFLSWMQDPTIQSALEVINAIHVRFVGSKGLYEHLVDTRSPRITFQILDLDRYGLSDDLYIKMNARGKPLTGFESFKARLESVIDDKCPGITQYLGECEVCLGQYFSHRIDTVWSDLFWPYRDQKLHLFDLQLMNFVRAVALVTYPLGNRDAAEPDKVRVIDELLKFELPYSFVSYQSAGCLSPFFVRALITMFDSLSGGAGCMAQFLSDGTYYDESEVFRRILSGGDLQRAEWIQFCGFCAYIIKHGPTDRPDQFYEWMRLVSNLSENSTYDTVDDLRKGLEEIYRLLEAIGKSPVLEFVADGSRQIITFNRQQIREERLKSQLLQKGAAWQLCIRRAEKHGYFKGQIEFLLKYSGVLDRWLETESCDWDSCEDEVYRRDLTWYFERASAVFGDEGLNPFDEYLWERALLSTGDYLLKKGRYNLSFLNDTDRDASWKRLLRGTEGLDVEIESKRTIVKEVFARIQPDRVAECLQEIIGDYLSGIAPSPDNWRRMIVECPDAISFCGARQIRIHAQDWVSLLSGKNSNCRQIELLTYYLKMHTLDSMLARGYLEPFSSIGYHLDGEDPGPCVYLEWKSMQIALDIRHKTGEYRFDVFSRRGSLPDQLKQLLITELAFNGGEADGVWLTIGNDKVLTTVDRIVTVLRSHVCDER